MFSLVVMVKPGVVITCVALVVIDVVLFDVIIVVVAMVG